MSRKRTRYVLPEHREAKALADYWGRAYYKSIWNCANLKATLILIQISADILKLDRSEEIQELEQQVDTAQKSIKETFDALESARSVIAEIKARRMR